MIISLSVGGPLEFQTNSVQGAQSLLYLSHCDLKSHHEYHQKLNASLKVPTGSLHPVTTGKWPVESIAVILHSSS